MKNHEQTFRAPSATRSGPRPGTSHRLLYLSLLLLAFSANCGVLQGAVPILGWLFPGKLGKMDKQAELLVEVQESLLRFADEYSMRMVGDVDNLRRGTDTLSPAEVLQLKIAIGSETWSIASGPNAVADLIDMTVFVTVIRMTLEDYSQPKVFGQSALPMLAYSRSAEADIWKLAGKVLKPEQQTDLRQSIAAWHHQNPLRKSLVALRSLDFASRVEAFGQNEVRKPGSVFSLLNVDPLAGMEPAVREVAQTRMFGERVLFVAQKMPTLLRCPPTAAGKKPRLTPYEQTGALNHAQRGRSGGLHCGRACGWLMDANRLTSALSGVTSRNGQNAVLGIFLLR